MTGGPTCLSNHLVASRDYLSPVVSQAVHTLRLPAGAWVLDAGTGAGGALPPLARAVGSAGRVRAVDLDPDTAALAAEHAARIDGRGSGRVSVESGDVLDVLDDAAFEPHGGFDAIWAGDLLCPDTVADPAATVAAMAKSLRPGGVVALFTACCRQATALAGLPRLERLTRAASALRRGLPHGDPQHHDRHLGWLVAAGLENVRLDTFARSSFPVRSDRSARSYLLTAVWPELLASSQAHGAEVGMTDAEIDELRAATTPGSPRYLLDDPGYFVVTPTLLCTGRAPRGRR